MYKRKSLLFSTKYEKLLKKKIKLEKKEHGKKKHSQGQNCYSYHTLKKEYKYICSYPKDVDVNAHAVIKYVNKQNEVTLLSFGGRWKHTLLMKYKSVWSKDRILKKNKWTKMEHKIGDSNDELTYVRAVIGGSKDQFLFIVYSPNTIAVFDVHTLQLVIKSTLPVNELVDGSCFLNITNEMFLFNCNYGVKCLIILMHILMIHWYSLVVMQMVEFILIQLPFFLLKKNFGVFVYTNYLHLLKVVLLLSMNILLGYIFLVALMELYPLSNILEFKLKIFWGELIIYLFFFFFFPATYIYVHLFTVIIVLFIIQWTETEIAFIMQGWLRESEITRIGWIKEFSRMITNFLL
ncbi:hypothetical protein RFI_00318 [Reticulomyxa filosa]|uniref:Uncharacterized protein n=1 Tax=Reticulomyxa filosa TaxID=46433 RepID=X6PGC6_RETFI|nr:hypothetical protein RFI_00318 [Reticulomyxa filosa]|eukprot:ETO36742.1 hypothetical protein RFI_00318 [Reticulomyxa filosa]